MGHARALLSFNDDEEMIVRYNQILENNLSVREVETFSKPSSKSPVFQPEEKIPLTKSQLSFKDFLGGKLASKVQIQKSSNGTGKITLNFTSEADLNRIIQILKH